MGGQLPVASLPPVVVVVVDHDKGHIISRSAIAPTKLSQTLLAIFSNTTSIEKYEHSNGIYGSPSYRPKSHSSVLGAVA
jgi:hypothetical protein